MQRALKRYLSVLEGTERPKFRTQNLSSRMTQAFDILQCCELCGHECLADRTAGEQGTCKVGAQMSISSIFEHHGEEPFFVPSLTVFFYSCTLSCAFCQNWEISQVENLPDTDPIDEQRLAEIIDTHDRCKNVNFVGGEPTPYLPFILKTLSHVKSDIPVVWNSNFFMSERSMDLLKGVVDVYLSDFKYGNDGCALRLSDVPDYSTIVKRNHQAAFEDAELVIRHLIMPNHLECCTRPILEFIADHFGDRVVVNLMDQYRPCFRAHEHPDIARRITADELQMAVSLAEELGLNFIT